MRTNPRTSRGPTVPGQAAGKVQFMDPVVPDIDVDDLADRLGDGTPLIDVRTPEEYEEAHAPGAVLIPLAELVERVDEVPRGTVFVICAVGSRSQRAAEFLQQQGIDAINIYGGTKAWIQAGHPVVTGSEPG